MLPHDVRQLVEQILLVFAALFPIVNPIGAAPVFLAMTPGLDRPERAVLARKVAINALALLVGSIAIGAYVIEFFGLSVPVVQLAGGLLVSRVALNLLSDAEVESPQLPARIVTPAHLASRAFYPLTMPLTVGPGSIATAITLGAHAPGVGVRSFATTMVGSIIGMALVALTIYILFKVSDRMTRVLGPTGTNVLLKLSAFILLCIGVQIAWNGASALLASVPALRAQ